MLTSSFICEIRAAIRAPLCIAVPLALLLSGCTLARLRDQSRQFYQANILVGTITAPTDWHGAVSVIATTRSMGKTLVVHRTWLHAPGGYELIVPDGEYTLHAFGDEDGDGHPDHHAPIASRSEPVKAGGDGMILMLDLTLSHEDPADIATIRNLPAAPRVTLPHSTQIGASVDMSAFAFSADTGVEGYWAPVDMFRRYGGNIYFLEPYDPGRIPVLFVHGAAGSVQDWRYFSDHLDRARYQSWFFQYPSGASLESMSHLLYWKLLNLQLRYGLERIHLVAHSMGGLVVRRFLLDHAQQFSQLGQFITLSTPWDGEPSAKLGVQYSPAVVPSWRDLQPGGDFLERLFNQPLPHRVEYSLLFSHRGGYNLIRPNSDGTVTLASQLHPPAQSEARRVLGFDEDHVSILRSPQAFAEVVRLLDDDGRSDASPDRSGGRIQPVLAFENSQSEPGPGIPLLKLSPVSTDGKTTQPPLLLPFSYPGGTGQLGPVPPGAYDVQAAVQSFKSTTPPQRIIIESGRVTPVTFSLTAQGVLFGQIGVSGDSIAYPAGSYRRPLRDIRLERIALEGPSGPRVLTPRREGPQEILSAYMVDRDDAVGGLFSFVNLPEGDYTLTVLGEGCEPHVSRHRVVHGKLVAIPPIMLKTIRR